MTTEHLIQMLADTHIIPMLLFLYENGPSTKTEVYKAVGRSANMPAKIDRLRGAGLVTVEVVGISEVVGLTDLGRSIADLLTEINSMMMSHTPE